MSRERFDAVLDRLDGLLDATEDDANRREIREIQQLVVGLKSDHESGAGGDGEDD